LQQDFALFPNFVSNSAVCEELGGPFLLPIFLCAAFAQNATDRVIAEAQRTSALEANLLNYRAMSDTFDKVDLLELRKHVVEASALTIGLANASEAPGPRLHHAQIERTLRETHLADQWQTFGMGNDWESG
jgi:hypothetical protein